MAIYVKEKNDGVYPELADYVLYANLGGELTGPTLITADSGTIVCAPGSGAYCLNGDVYFLSDAGVWTLQ